MGDRGSLNSIKKFQHKQMQNKRIGEKNPNISVITVNGNVLTPPV